MENEDFYEEDLVVKLTIDGTDINDVEVIVSDSNKTIREQISSIVSVFELPKIDCGGNSLDYLLGQIMEDDSEPEIFQFEDTDGRELAVVDYGVQSGDRWLLISVPLAGYACPIPKEMEKEWQDYCMQNI